VRKPTARLSWSTRGYSAGVSTKNAMRPSVQPKKHKRSHLGTTWASPSDPGRAASTVAIVAIAAVVIVALLALIYILPREADRAGRGLLGDGFWGQVRGFSGRLRALGGRGASDRRNGVVAGKRRSKRCSSIPLPQRESSVVRRGSSVRVRQRALQKRRKTGALSRALHSRLRVSR
jgi:hypothetical protein